ncbi:Myosin light chain kinase [Diplonema papillatum]|nr:Myosin light chain kinase [Diplonema papillatum]
MSQGLNDPRFRYEWFLKPECTAAETPEGRCLLARSASGGEAELPQYAFGLDHLAELDGVLDFVHEYVDDLLRNWSVGRDLQQDQPSYPINVVGLNDPRFRYEWFLKPECTAAETPEGRCLLARSASGGEAELPQYAFGLDHLAELDGVLDFVHEHVDDLLRNWSVGRDLQQDQPSYPINVVGLNDPRFRYEWFLKPECTAAETPEGRCLLARSASGGEAELPQYAFGLDHLAELDGVLDFVHEHVDDLLRNWSVGRDLQQDQPSYPINVVGLNDPRFRYEWFLKPECTAAETPEGRCLPARGAGGGEAELPQYAFGLDHLAELDGALDFVHEVVEHADDLLRNWSVGRDRYLKYFCLHLLDPDAPLVPSMGIQTAAHVHMCAPSQYRHAMQYYCKGKYLPFEAPAALSKSGMTATQVTTQAWLRHFDEEYLSFQMDASALNVVARSPRQYSPERPGSNDAKRRRSLLKQAGSVPAIDAKVRFKTGATNSSFVVTKRGSDSNSGTPPPAPLSVASRGEASDRNETSSQAGSAVKDDDKPPTEPGGTPLETTQPAGKIRPSHFTQSADEAGPVQSAQPAVKFRPSSFAKSVDNIAPAESTPPAVKFRPSSFAKSVDNIGPSDCAQAADGMQPVDSTPPAVKFRPSSFAKSVDNIGPSESTQAAVKYRPSSFAKSVDDIGSSESAQPARKPDPLNTTQPADSIHPLDATQSERKPDPLNTTQPADSIQPLDFAQSAENGVADLSLFEPVGDEASPTALGRGAKDPCENSDNMITQSAFFVAEGNGDLPRGDTA